MIIVMFDLRLTIYEIFSNEISLTGIRKRHCQIEIRMTSYIMTIAMSALSATIFASEIKRQSLTLKLTVNNNKENNGSSSELTL